MTFDAEQIVLEDIASPFTTRDDISQTYALALRHAHVVDWPKVKRCDHRALVRVGA